MSAHAGTALRDLLDRQAAVREPIPDQYVDAFADAFREMDEAREALYIAEDEISERWATIEDLRRDLLRLQDAVTDALSGLRDALTAFKSDGDATEIALAVEGAIDLLVEGDER